jgi:large subunit ribosomal protein L22
MEIKVHNLYVRTSPRKMRPVLHGLRGQTAQEAKTNLQFVNKKGADFLYNLVKSGIAAAKENYLEADQVLIKEIFCNEGPRLKRIIPWSKGQARRIVKKMSHLTLVLESKEDVKPAKNVKEVKKEENKENKEVS